MVKYFKRFFIASFPAITGGVPLSDFLLCMVPSHEKGKWNDGIANVISDYRNMFRKNAFHPLKLWDEMPDLGSFDKKIKVVLCRQ